MNNKIKHFFIQTFFGSVIWTVLGIFTALIIEIIDKDGSGHMPPWFGPFIFGIVGFAGGICWGSLYAIFQLITSKSTISTIFILIISCLLGTFSGYVVSLTFSWSLCHSTLLTKLIWGSIAGGISAFVDIIRNSNKHMHSDVARDAQRR